MLSTITDILSLPNLMIIPSKNLEEAFSTLMDVTKVWDPLLLCVLKE